MGRQITGWAFALIAVVVIWSALPGLEHGFHTRPGDGAVDWLGARAWLAHVNVYSPEGLKMYGLSPYGFAHPPTAPFWLLPYAEWDVDMLGTMMAWTTLLLLVFHCIVTVEALHLPGGAGLAALAVGLVISTSWFENDLAMAQVSEPIAFCYLLAWLLLRRGNDVLAGIAIGLACTFKPFAGVMWIFLVCLRRWRGAASAIVAWLAVAALMTSRFGLDAWLQWNQFNKATAVVWIGHLRNATLPGLVLRALYPICRFHVAHAPTLGATIIAGTAGLAVISACVWRTRSLDRSPQRIDLLFAAWTAASVFVNPVAWEHYAFLLVTPVAIVLSVSFDSLASWRTRTLALSSSLASIALLSVNMHSKGAAMQKPVISTVDHLRLHWLEAANWLPWAVVLVSALCLAWRLDQRSSCQPSSATRFGGK